VKSEKREKVVMGMQSPSVPSALVRVTSLIGCMFLLSSCSHLSKNSVEASANIISPMGVTNSAIAFDGSSAVVDLDDKGTDLQAVPLEVNRQVLQWIDYFQGQGRPHMERYLSRSTRYMPIMKKILKEQGLPEDLIYIALIESGFSGTAHSSANAVGYWQFIRGTGRRYGLKIDTYVDERRDFILSTQAAAEYFKGLYGIFHSWYLAIASYNVGEGRVKNLVVKYRTRDFWQLARENKLPDETSNYVPKFLAARLIAKEPEKYGFTDIDYQQPLEYTEVVFSNSIDLRKLASAMGLEYDDLRDLNLSYKRGVAFEKNGKLKLRMPKGTEEKALASAPLAVPDNVKIYVADDDYSYYRVRRGDTISIIAKKFGTSPRVIRKLNRLSANTALSTGRRLRVPAENVAGLSSGDRANARRNGSQNNGAGAPKLGTEGASQYMVKGEPSVQGVRRPATPERAIHIVRRGDTLAEIARKYRVSVRDLAKRNKIPRRARVAVGTRLEIPQ